MDAEGQRVEWHYFRAPEIEELADDERTVVVLPTASVEQHGAHLPVGTDALLVYHVTLEAARSLVDKLPVLVLPPVWSGFARHHMEFAGTISLSGSTFRTVVREIVGSVFHHGFDRLVVINGHGGNTVHLQAAAVEIGADWERVVPVVNYWDLIPQGREVLAETPPTFPGHAGEFETSLLLDVLDGKYIDMKAARPSQHIPENPYVAAGQTFLYRDFMEFTRGTGVSGDPTLADQRKGHRLTMMAVQALAAFLEDFSTWDVDDVRSLFRSGPTP